MKFKLKNGTIILIDKEDLEKVSKYSWDINNSGYVRVSLNLKTKYTGMLLHRFIMGLTDPNIKLDHIDCNKLNNQKTNLRIATMQQNARNRTKTKKLGYSKFKGVSFNKRKNKWIAAIYINYKRHHLGYFKDEISAAKAYNKAAIQNFGEFARINEC